MSGSVKNLTPGKYYCASSVIDFPLPGEYWFVEIFTWASGVEKLVRAYKMPGGQSYQCTFNSAGVWSQWTTE